MYRVDKALDLSFLLGTDLNQIALGRYDVQFIFDCTSKICLQSRATVLLNGEEIAEWNEDGWSSLEFQKILNESVLGFSVPTDRLIEIQFTNGFRLCLYDDSDQYESMQIYQPDPAKPMIVI